VVGRRQLVGLRGLAAAHAARGPVPARIARAALPRLRLLLERHALRDGDRLPGRRLRLRDAPRHERARAHLPRALSPRGLDAAPRAPGAGHERRRPDERRPAPAALRRLPRQPRLLLPRAEGAPVSRSGCAWGALAVALLLGAPARATDPRFT